MDNKAEHPQVRHYPPIDLGKRKFLGYLGKAGALAIISVGTGAGLTAAVDRFAGKSGSEMLGSYLDTYLGQLGRDVKERHLEGSPLYIHDTTGDFDPQGLTDLYNFPFFFSDKPLPYNLGQAQDAVIRINAREALKRHDLLIAETDDSRPSWTYGNDGYSLVSKDGRGLTYIRKQNDPTATVQELTTQLLLAKYSFEVDGISSASSAQVAKLFASSVGRALALKLNGFAYEDYIANTKRQGMRFSGGDKVFLFYKLEKDVFEALPQPQNINLFRKTTQPF